MQTIVHSYKHELKTLRQVEELYTQLSELKHTNVVTHILFLPIVNMFNTFGLNVKEEYLFDTAYDVTDYKPLDLFYDDTIMVVCCSGGKDSVATALLYKKWGYKVILYHMKGINPAYWDEFKAVKKIADDLEITYYIDEVKLKGKHDYVEHPMKNMLIANGAIQFCLDNDLPVNIAFGNYNSSKLEDMDFEIDGGDSRDMWDEYEYIVSHEIPNFKIHTPLESVKETYEGLINYGYGLKLVQDSISCMSPYRFRQSWKERTEKKYGVHLMNNRCGCCWKCCLEYMVLVDYHIFTNENFFNQEYYNHCFEILKNTALKETGHTEATVDQIWNRYFWYDISESHLIITI